MPQWRQMLRGRGHQLRSQRLKSTRERLTWCGRRRAKGRRRCCTEGGCTRRAKATRSRLTETAEAHGGRTSVCLRLDFATRFRRAFDDREEVSGLSAMSGGGEELFCFCSHVALAGPQREFRGAAVGLSFSRTMVTHSAHTADQQPAQSRLIARTSTRPRSTPRQAHMRVHTLH